ncbi:SDR family NAD(P)-dependent oxidoreductase [Ilumatobacter nonamiensis]|uniref:SDR family NAD(P)-dependent oxidoreductase n=1 Tax=Ilumatobacter nonamiensis TaxID=467093 RepID=UPI00034AD5C1|nr:SDR family oxidoreductase [Ilumatobacter nonamiensis]
MSTNQPSPSTLGVDLTGKAIIVTGASSGIGHHIAGTLAANGATVVLGARRADRLATRVDEITDRGGRALALPLDVCDSESARSFLADAEAEVGPLHALVNNAGVESTDTYLTSDEEAWDRVMDTNLKSVWMMSKLFSEQVIRNDIVGATIVNMSSLTAERAIKGQFAYVVSKGGVSRLTEVMALESARHGIRVNALAPGYIHTAATEALTGSDLAAGFERAIPMRRFGQFEDLDGPLLLLVSEASAYMTGSVIRVDGGHAVQSLTL